MLGPIQPTTLPQQTIHTQQAIIPCLPALSSWGRYNKDHLGWYTVTRLRYFLLLSRLLGFINK